MRSLLAGAFAFALFSVPAGATPAAQAAATATASPLPSMTPAAGSAPVPVPVATVVPHMTSINAVNSITTFGGMVRVVSDGASGGVPTISITGKGSVTRVPDRAIVSISISAQSDAAASASDSVAMAAGDIQKAVERIPGVVVTSSNLSVNLYAFNGSSQPANANTSLEVTLEDVRSLPAVRAIVAEHPGAGINNVRYDVRDRAKASTEAIAAALLNAKAQMDALAAKTSLKVVKLTGIQASVQSQYPNTDDARAVTIAAIATESYEVSAP